MTPFTTGAHDSSKNCILDMSQIIINEKDNT